MTLKDTITEDMKAAMRAKDAPKLSAIRMLLAALKQKEVDERVTLTDADVVAIVERELKKRRDSIEQYQKAGRADLLAVEEFEVGVLMAYMPKQMSEAELADAVSQAITASGASGAKDMGKVMAALKPILAGRADMSKVSGIVKAKLSGG